MNEKQRLLPQLETERLILKVPTKEDGAALSEAIVESFDVFRKWLPWATHLPSLKESEDFCIEAHNHFLAQTSYTLLFFEKPSGALVGISDLREINWHDGQCQVGYWGRKKYWGNGYITEGASALIHYAKTELDFNRIALIADDKNERSCKMAERLGFVLEGIMHSYRLNNNGQLRDFRLYAQWKPFAHKN